MNTKPVEGKTKESAIGEATFKARIDSRGRIVVPKEVRDALSIDESNLIKCKISKVHVRSSETSELRKHPDEFSFKR